MKRADTYDEIMPLIELCKAGKVFDVQKLAAAGRPLNQPPELSKGRRQRSPLECAIDSGCHSMVQVLLDGGADVESGDKYCALSHAVEKRRLDLVQLLVEHGGDAKSLDMGWVFGSWDPAIVEYLIEHGADPEAGNPLAVALCNRIRPALGIFKKYQGRFPSFQKQVDIALRHHCSKWNQKWVSLMLWAGADPCAKGPDNPYDEDNGDSDYCALQLAAWGGHSEFFEMKRVGYDPGHEYAFDILRSACYSKELKLLTSLLSHGYCPNDKPDGTSSLIFSIVNSMAWHGLFRSEGVVRLVDSDEARNKLMILSLLLKHGAKWRPAEKHEYRAMRKSLKELVPDYTAEFVWLMTKHQACERSTMQELLRPEGIRIHVHAHYGRILELIERLPESFERKADAMRANGMERSQP